jgi:hypothetical protein
MPFRMSMHSAKVSGLPAAERELAKFPEKKTLGP